MERLLLICFLLSSRLASNVCGPVLSTGLTIQVRGHPCQRLRMQTLLALLQADISYQHVGDDQVLRGAGYPQFELVTRMKSTQSCTMPE